MKILDKYVIKSFLTGYFIAFCVLIGLRIILELFINLDEFTEKLSELGTLSVIKNILSFYAMRATLYFRDFAGVITVVAAAFSFFKMVRSGELIAITASGVNLKRVMAPIIILALIFTTVLVIDQEIIIPSLSNKLSREEDDIPGQESYYIHFVLDGKGSLLLSQKFDVLTSTIHNPSIITRKKIGNTAVMAVTGWIFADSAFYNEQEKQWELENGFFVESGSLESPKSIDAYASDITPKDIPIRHKAKYKNRLSSKQLRALAAAAKTSNIKDLPQLYSQIHFRITDPLINLVMLMISLPLLICRDPKTMKSAITISFGLTTACFITTFICKMLATEYLFELRPEVWAWMPVFIFLPVAFIEFDAMKT
ncbi:MAG: LptF/LptG family permease [Planctomycetota bacterium]|jgi:lipopolysaccharide export system permease protein